MAATLRRRLLLASGLCLSLAACETVPMNTPLTSADLTPDQGEVLTISKGGYRFGQLKSNGASPEFVIAMSFSGGGKRSSAFAYGVLKGLRDLTFTIDGVEHRLLDEVDYISSVSGGSFPAAYYGLYRDGIFDNFEKDFLRVDIDRYIIGVYLLPWNWQWAVNPLYGTNDEMAKIYDKLMFHGATYADLEQKGEPVISINATDINYGTVFPFTQEQFDLLCSNLDGFPVARAVAASNGFPILFTPITLADHSAECGGRIPSWIPRAESGPELSRERYLARNARLYLDPKKTKWVHLLDGGIADNLAMRSITNAILSRLDDEEGLRLAGLDHVRRLLVISADGQASADSSWPQNRLVTSIGQIFSAVSGTQIDANNFETLLLAESELNTLAERVRKIRCAEVPEIDGHPCDDVQAHFVHLSLADIADAAVRERLDQIPTGLTLTDENVDLLIAAGEKQVKESPVIAAFARSLAGAPLTQ